LEQVSLIVICARIIEPDLAVVEERFDQRLRCADAVAERLLEGVVGLEVKPLGEAPTEFGLQRVVPEDRAVAEEIGPARRRVGQELPSPGICALNIGERQVGRLTIAYVLEVVGVGQGAAVLKIGKYRQGLATRILGRCTGRVPRQQEVGARAEEVGEEAVIEDVNLVEVNASPEDITAAAYVANFDGIGAEFTLDAEVVLVDARRLNLRVNCEDGAEVREGPSVVRREGER